MISRSTQQRAMAPHATVPEGQRRNRGTQGNSGSCVLTTKLNAVATSYGVTFAACANISPISRLLLSCFDQTNPTSGVARGSFRLLYATHAQLSHRGLGLGFGFLISPGFGVILSVIWPTEEGGVRVKPQPAFPPLPTRPGIVEKPAVCLGGF